MYQEARISYLILLFGPEKSFHHNTRNSSRQINLDNPTTYLMFLQSLTNNAKRFTKQFQVRSHIKWLSAYRF